MTREQKVYYDLMMNNIPNGVSREDWEKEVLEDISLEESSQNEILNRSVDHVRLVKKTSRV